MERGFELFFIAGGGHRPGAAGTFVEGLVVDAIFAYVRMKNAHFSMARNTKHETEWLIYTDILSRFLGVDVTDLRNKLIEERESCRDLRLCSDRIFFWAYSKIRPW